MRNIFNYKQVFEHPITLYRFGKYTLPFGISLVRIILFVLIFLLMLLFHPFVNKVFVWFSGMETFVYLAIPYLLSSALLKFKKDGKKIHFFISDFVRYFFSIYLPKKKYCNDQEVLYTGEKVTFEPVYMKRGGFQHEVENANETNIQKLDAHRRGRHMGVLSHQTGSHTNIQ